MAIPTVASEYPYPYSDSPSRTFYQGAKVGKTVGVYKIIDSCTASTPFRLTHFAVSVYDPTSGCTGVYLLARGDVVFQCPGNTAGSYIMTISPHGILTSNANSCAVRMSITGDKCGVVCYASGYED